MHNMLWQQKNGRPERDALASVSAAAAVIVAATVVAAVVAAKQAVTTAAAGEQNDQDDDPPAAVATKAIIAHKKYLRKLFEKLIATHSMVFRSAKKVQGGLRILRRCRDSE